MNVRIDEILKEMQSSEEVVAVISDIIEQHAIENGIDYIDFPIPDLDECDLLGIPEPTKNKP